MSSTLINYIDDKWHLSDYPAPHYKVFDKVFYSKFKAVKECVKTGWEWPTFQMWSHSQKFKRPNISFQQACARQCELISDTSKKVRLWYSGGRDSHHILINFLETKAKLDEICIYRRFPGIKDNTTNEFDFFNIKKVLETTLKNYNTNIKVKIYDLMPEHFYEYSKNLNLRYFPYKGLDFFGHSIHAVYECYPELQNDKFINIYGVPQPEVEENTFYWSDGNLNYNFADPYTLNFYADQRNTDIAVLQAYAKKDNNIKGELDMKNYLNYAKNNTPLDNNWCEPDINHQKTVRHILDHKDLCYMANATRTDIGKKTLSNFCQFYDDVENKYRKYFVNGNIYYAWIGSISEKHILLDV
jgi:hypothetical protein